MKKEKKIYSFHHDLLRKHAKELDITLHDGAKSWKV